MSAETLSAHAVNIGAVGIVGTFLGMPLDALFLGAFAGFLVLGFNPASTKTGGAANVCMGTLLAGSLSPAVVKFLAVHFEIAPTAEEEIEALRPFVPVLIGALWQWAAPRLSFAVQNILNAVIGRITDFWGDRR